MAPTLSNMQVGTAQYDREYQAVKLYGAKNNSARDAYQQLTPYFWADDVSKSCLYAFLVLGTQVMLNFTSKGDWSPTCNILMQAGAAA